MIRTFKNTILIFTIITLITTNILTLLYQPFTTAISTALATAFGISTVTSLMSDSIDLKDIEINKHKKATAKMRQKIASKEKALQKYHAQARQRKLAVKNIGNMLLQRTRKLALRTVAAIPGKAIPVIGTGAILGGTAYEIISMCEIHSGIVQLKQECGVSDLLEKDIMTAVCSKI